MLGRLRMSVQDTIQAYVGLAEGVFSETKWIWKEGTYRASNLERAIKVIVGRYGIPETNRAEVPAQERDERDAKVGSNVRMLEREDNKDRCRVFVCSVTADNFSSPTLFRTYIVPANTVADCYIWEAARATSAAPKFFKPIIIEENGVKMRYIDGGLRCNNPTKELLSEAANYFAGRTVACILSIGTGRRGKIQLPDVGLVPKLQLLKVISLLQKISLDCEQTHQELAHRLHNQGTYFRFNVDYGMENIGLAEWDMSSSMQADTRAYTREHSTTHNIDDAVAAIMNRKRDGMLTITRAAGR
ncbi:hypothetical protein FRC07_008615 [Ceratobasidium sp. 392]|nr:hypothetical protein FRC07_008615 [Ceratobasidium sp. 392]